jgi:hypothetical protein
MVKDKPKLSVNWALYFGLQGCGVGGLVFAARFRQLAFRGDTTDSLVTLWEDSVE